jgi:cell division protein FtsN
MASFGYFMLFRPARKAELAVSEQIAQMDGGIANTPAPAVANQPAIINSIKSSQSAQISNEISEVTGKTTSETKETLVSKPEREVKAPVEEAEKPAEKAAKRKENDHFYAVQVGVFSAKANAEKLAGKLKGEGYTAGVKKTEKGYRVLVGRFETGEKAEPLYKKLKMQGYQAVRYSE